MKDADPAQQVLERNAVPRYVGMKLLGMICKSTQTMELNVEPREVDQKDMKVANLRYRTKRLLITLYYGKHQHSPCACYHCANRRSISGIHLPHIQQNA